MVEEIKKLPEVTQAKMLIIQEGSLETRGFVNLYEILGFIDLQCNPQFLKQTVIQRAEKEKQGAPVA